MAANSAVPSALQLRPSAGFGAVSSCRCRQRSIAFPQRNWALFSRSQIPLSGCTRESRSWRCVLKPQFSSRGCQNSGYIRLQLPEPADRKSRLPGNHKNLLSMSSPQTNSLGAGASHVAAVSGLPSASEDHKKLVLTFGEMLIDFVPTVNGVSLAEAPGFIPAPGGAPANVAVGVSRLGGQAAFVGKVGDDEFGRMLVRILEQNGVNVHGVRLDSSARTSLAFVTLRSDGEREFMFYRHPSADMLLTPDELDEDLIAQAAVVHYGSISLIAEPCRSAHLKLLELAAANGAILSYDANLRLPLWPSAKVAKEEILSIWDKATVAKLSDEEVLFLTEVGAKPSAASINSIGLRLEGNLDELDERALSLWSDNLRVLLVTEGNKGCRYYMRGAFGIVPGFKVDAVDATGAGDAFVAAFLLQLAESPDILDSEDGLRKALGLANACGAITTTKRGAIPSLPTKDDALELMQANVRK